MKKEVENFIKEFCTKVYNMPFSDLELYMDNHKCIKWSGKEYFMPEDNSFYTKDDDIIYKFLNEYHHV